MFSAFQTSNHNVACSYTMLVVHYNCALTSYMLYFTEMNNSSDSVIFATFIFIISVLVGHLLFGIFGDSLGMKRSFNIGIILLICGSFLNMFFGSFSIIDKSTIHVLSQFILGLGAGIVYPLIAIIMRENNSVEIANAMLALIYGPIGSVGLIAPPSLFFVLTCLDIFDEWKWKILTGLGIILVLPVLWVKDSFTAVQQQQSVSGYLTLKMSIFVFMDELNGLGTSAVRPFLLGTSTALFCSDLLFYGNLIFQIQFVKYLLSSSSFDDDYVSEFSVITVAAIRSIFAILFWAGGLCSIYALQTFSALGLQLHGFVLCSVSFFLVATCKSLLPHGWWPVTIAVYSLTYFFAGFGSSPGTFLIPSLLFPPGMRSMACGLIAAFGKLGAISGILIAGCVGFEISNLMALFGGVSMLGIGATVFIIQANMKVVGASSSSHRRSYIVGNIANHAVLPSKSSVVTMVSAFDRSNSQRSTTAGAVYGSTNTTVIFDNGDDNEDEENSVLIKNNHV